MRLKQLISIIFSIVIFCSCFYLIWAYWINDFIIAFMILTLITVIIRVFFFEYSKKFLVFSWVIVILLCSVLIVWFLFVKSDYFVGIIFVLFCPAIIILFPSSENSVEEREKARHEELEKQRKKEEEIRRLKDEKTKKEELQKLKIQKELEKQKIQEELEKQQKQEYLDTEQRKKEEKDKKVELWKLKDVETLIKELGNPNFINRSLAAYCLGVKKEKRAVDALIEALRDENDTVIENVVNALGEIGDPRALEYLRNLTNPNLFDKRKIAIEKLKKIKFEQIAKDVKTNID
jgi:hypothetical protein